jgi:hypothetical protein
MCWRFHMGSKSPLAKRKARMFWAASFPRKWSIRKTCSSSNTSWTTEFRWRAEGRSVPNGFSMMMRARSVRPVQPARRASEGRLGLLYGLGQSGCAVGARHIADVPREPLPLFVGDLAPHELVTRHPGRLSVGVVIDALQRGSDYAELGHQTGSRQVVEAGQELPAGKIPGRSEQHDYVRRGRAMVVSPRGQQLGGLSAWTHLSMLRGSPGIHRALWPRSLRHPSRAQHPFARLLR